MWLFWVVFGAVAVALVLVMVGVERRRSAARAAEHESAAARLGALYASAAPEALLSKLGGFDLTYSDGVRLPHFVRDVFALNWSTGELYIFLHEHRGTLPGGTGAAGAMTHRETVACLTSPALALPRFRLSPERPLEKLISLFGLRDIDFASHPGFSGSYYLHSDSEAAARRLFGSKVLNYFENHPGWHVEGRGDALVIYRFAKVAALDELPEFVRAAQEISSLFQA